MIWDRIIIFGICVMVMAFHPFSVSLVIAMLVSVIFTCIIIYFDLRAVTTALNVVYMILCIMWPPFVCFMPLMLYSCIYKEMEWISIVYILPLVSENGYILIVVSASIIAIYLALKTNQYERKKSMFEELQDEYLAKQLDVAKMQSDMAGQQDDKIRMATLAERNRIAREIHDNVGHMLSRAILQVGAMQAINKDAGLKEHFSKLQQTLTTAMNSIRESVHDLRDESFDLRNMINQMVHEYNTLKITFDYDMRDSAPRELKYCFAAIVKEALTNVVRHSNATRVSIIIREHPAFYQLLIEDNGTNASEGDKSGMGIENMKDRVAAFDGNITISAENGFRIFVSILKKDTL